MAEIKPISSSFDPMQALQMFNLTQHLGMQQQQMDIRKQELGLTERLRQMQTEREQTQEKHTKMNDLRDMLLRSDELGLTDEQWLSAQDQLLQHAGVEGVNPELSKQALTEGKSLYANVRQFREENPDAPIPAEMQGQLKGYLQKYGAKGARLARDTQQMVNEDTMKQALNGDVNAFASLASKNHTIAEHLAAKEYIGPKEQKQIDAMNANIARVGEDTKRLKAQSGLLLQQTAQTEQRVQGYKDFVQPMHQLQLLKQGSDNAKVATEVELAQAKNKNLKAFMDSIPQRKDALKQEKDQTETQEKQLSDMLDAINADILPDESIQAGFKANGIKDKSDLEARLAALRAKKEDLTREGQYLDAPTEDNFKAWQSGPLMRKQGLMQAGEALKQERVALQEGALNLQRSKFDYKKVSGEAQTFLDTTFYQIFNKTHDENLAAQKALEITSKKYPGMPVEIKDLRDKTKMGGVTVNIPPQEKAEHAKVGGEFGEQYTNLQKADIASREKLSKLDRMEQLSEGVYSGTLAPSVAKLQGLAQSLGFEIDPKLGAKQAMEALSNEMALNLRNPSGGAGMPGALSDKDREFLTAMPPGLSKTPEGNKMIIETTRALEKRNQEVAKMARAYRKKNGQFDEGFYEELAAYSEAHPLFAGKSMPEASAAPGAGWSIKPVGK